MSTSIEQLFSELFSELVGVALEYSEGTVTDIFIYASLEGGYYFDPFFADGAEVLGRHKLPDVDTSAARQDALLDYGVDQLERFAKSTVELGQPVPTEIKLHYVVASGKTDADVKYEPQHSMSATLSVFDIREAWMAEVGRSLTSRSATE